MKELINKYLKENTIRMKPKSNILKKDVEEAKDLVNQLISKLKILIKREEKISKEGGSPHIHPLDLTTFSNNLKDLNRIKANLDSMFRLR